MSEATDITVAYGDGIGPEIMEATLLVLKEAGASLNIETIEVGEKLYKFGESTGIPAEAWESLRRTKVFLKAPITTPQGGGYKSLNVTVRKTLGLYANVRPCASYYPYVERACQNMDMVIIRENEEDLYAGIEYRSTPGVFEAVKMITRDGCERIARYAFEYAVQNNRKKVTCMSKDNIMKLTDGLFHRVYDEVSEDYPSIEKEHFIIDIGSARIASRPEHFDVIVTENLYGDIISDIAAETSGSVGLAGSANIGEDFGMFEAIHGSAPDIAGQDIANPSGLLNGAVMMLVHIGQGKVAEKIQNAWLRTLEDGMHTGDIFGPKSAEKLGTQAFAEAVCKRLGQLPQEFTPVEYPELPEREKKEYVPSPELSQEKTLIGVDVFISWSSPDINMLAKRLIECAGDTLELKIISCKGLKVWPDYESGSNLAEQYRCRFRVIGASGTAATVSALLKRITSADLEFLKAINLYAFDGTPGFSMSQGE